VLVVSLALLVLLVTQAIPAHTTDALMLMSAMCPMEVVMPWLLVATRLVVSLVQVAQQDTLETLTTPMDVAM